MAARRDAGEAMHSRIRRMLICGVSIGTALWLLGLAAATIKKSDDLWPVAFASSLNKAQNAGSHAEIIARTQHGLTRVLQPEDFGVPHLRPHIAHLITSASDEIPHPARGSDWRFHRMIEAFNRRHPADRAVSAVLRATVIPLPKGSAKTRVYDVLTWHA